MLRWIRRYVERIAAGDVEPEGIALYDDGKFVGHGDARDLPWRYWAERRSTRVPPTVRRFVAAGLFLAATLTTLIGGLAGWGLTPTIPLATATCLASIVCCIEGIRQAAYARRLVDNHVITQEKQHEAADRPVLRKRLLRATELVRGLRRHRDEPALDGILEIDDDLVDRVHYELVKPLVELAGTESTVSRAATLPELADRVEHRRAELDAAYAAVDSRIAQVADLIMAADAVLAAQRRVERVHTLAEELDAQPSLAAAELPTGDDLTDKLAVARAALNLLTTSSPAPR